MEALTLWDNDAYVEHLLRDAKLSPDQYASNLLLHLRNAASFNIPKLQWGPYAIKATVGVIPFANVLEPVPIHLCSNDAKDDDDEEEQTSFDRWRSQEASSSDNLFSRSMPETVLFSAPELDQDILEYHTNWERRQAQESAGLLLHELCSKLKSWRGCSMPVTTCVARIIQLPNGNRNMLFVSYISITTLAAALYGISTNDELKMMRILELEIPVESFVTATICPVSQRLALVRQSKVTVFDGATGMLEEQIQQEKHHFTACCWMPLGRVLLLTWVHARGNEGRVVSWKSGQAGATNSLLEFKGVHIIQVRPSSAVSETQVLCGILRSDFTVSIALWFFLAASSSDGETQPERESLQIIANLTTPVFVSAPSIDWNSLNDFLVHGGGILTVWTQNNLLGELAENYNIAAFKDPTTRPIMWPKAKAAFQVTEEDLSGMFVSKLFKDNLVIVNLGRKGIGLLDTDSGTMTEIDFGQEDIIGVSKVMNSDTSISISIRTTEEMHIRVFP